MLSVDKDNNVLDDKKEAAVTTPFLYKKLFTTENFTTSDELQTNVLRILQQVRRLLKILMRFTNILRRLQQMRRLTKVLKTWNI